ncbi:MAG: transglutaminase domain-containing protein [Planctomycetaceae bacterium]|nr:transglutaminase domain-containing protein [Planctomycetaceae bacterium]
MRAFALFFSLWTALWIGPPLAASEPDRAVRIDYRFEISDLPAGEKLRVWCPVPQNTADQQVELQIGSEWSVAVEGRYGNRIAYRELTTIDSLSTHGFSFTVKRREVRSDQPADNAQVSDVDPAIWLQPSRLVPVAGKHVGLLASVPVTASRREQARQIYAVVLNHVDYRKDQPGWGRGDTAWVCDSRFGNCTDFHSLFISMMRSRGIPARFEIGFSIPSEGKSGDLTGYHCWAWFQDEDGTWVPVDISEADKHPELSDYYFGNLSPHRVTMTTGRDIKLVPKQAGDPLNFFVAPYAEINGKPVEKEHIHLQHRWQQTPLSAP